MKELTNTNGIRHKALSWPMLLGFAVACLVLTLGWGPGQALANPPAQDAGKAAPSGGECPNGQCFTDVPPGNVFFDNINEIYLQGLVSGYTCGVPPAGPCDEYHRPYYLPGVSVPRQQMAKYVDQAREQPGIDINTATFAFPLISRTTVENGFGLYGIATNGNGVTGESAGRGHSGVYGINRGDGDGVVGETGSAGRSGVYGYNSGNGRGVTGRSEGDGQGVYGESVAQDGVQGRSYSVVDSGVYGLNLSGGFGVAGRNNGLGEKAAVFGENTGGGNAGYFAGDVIVTGTCCAAAAGSYRMDHPLDPANKYLNYSAVQSPDMMNVYNGNVTTDAKGEAVVQLPQYIEALNRDFRYQLTVIGQFAQAIVSSEIATDSFTILTDKPNVKVSWQVTGVRADPYAEQHRLPVEQAKPEGERGYYLHPDLYGQSSTQRVEESLRP